MTATDTKHVGGAPGPQSFGTPGVENIVDGTYGATRVSLKPADYQIGSFLGGHYRLMMATGALTGVAAGGAIASMRWALSNGIYALKRAQIAVVLTTAFTAPQQLDFDIVRATGFTAPDTGGAAAVLTGSNNKKRNIMGPSQVADLRVATTAALGAGTRTQDAQAFGGGVVAPSAANTIFQTAGFVDLYKEDTMAEHPEAFGNNEGYQVRCVTAMGAAGVVKAYLVFDWLEAPGL